MQTGVLWALSIDSHGRERAFVSSAVCPTDSHASPSKTVVSVLPLESFKNEVHLPGPCKRIKSNLQLKYSTQAYVVLLHSDD